MQKKKFKIGIAPDSFKGSLTALEAATCIERGLKKALKNISFVKVAMADGGEGTVTALVESTKGKFLKRTVLNPRKNKIKAEFGITGDGKTAVIEMAAASGLCCRQSLRSKWRVSTYTSPRLLLSFGTR